MSEPLSIDFFYTIEKESVAEFKDRGSRFLSFAFPIETKEQFKEHLKKLKEEHPKAVHHCFAYRIGTGGNNFRSSDDGEPSGTAGRPILGQIDSHQLTNIAVVVVRYFGGTLLGVPGLINAYKTAASFALQLNPFIKKPVLVNYRLQFDYTQMNEVMILVKKHFCEVVKQEMQLFCLLEIGIPKNNLEFVLSKLESLHKVEIEKMGV
ncbi:MAG TPA: YigZ family protein [Chitinophagaceae bacterium]|nr:YigZ family protein [Chitinophagaceae bacterium]